jgi:hypothetical protein
LSTADWWRVNVSIGNLLYQEGCLVYEKRRRSVTYKFKHNDDIVVYHWDQPSKFYFKGEYLNKCFIVEYYKFLGDRYIYSATLIKGDE